MGADLFSVETAVLEDVLEGKVHEAAAAALVVALVAVHQLLHAGRRRIARAHVVTWTMAHLARCSIARAYWTIFIAIKLKLN
jgi:hypothetical protein